MSMQDPERYETFKSAPGRDNAEFVPMLIGKMSWKDGERILDYGCGAGSVCTKYFLPMAQLYNSRIDCVDISEEMLNYAKRNNSHPLIQYHQGNIVSNNFPLKGATFDRIFSIYVLHFVKDYKSALKRFFEMLKPGGEFGFTVITVGLGLTILEMIAKMPKWSPYMVGYEEFIPVWRMDNDEDAEGVFRDALLEIGFVISEIKTEERLYDFDLEMLVEMFLSLNPYLKRIPADLQDELKEDYRNVSRDFLKPLVDGYSVRKYYMLFALVSKPMINS